jgi:hypothetical protein
MLDKSLTKMVDIGLMEMCKILDVFKKNFSVQPFIS